MKLKITGLAWLMAMALPCMGAVIPSSDERVTNLSVERTDNSLLVNMTLDLTGLKLKSDREITFIPVITAGDSVVELPQVIAAGRNRYIQHQRHNDIDEGATLTRAGHTIDYQAIVPYRRWMADAMLSMAEDECGCGLSLGSPSTSDLAQLDFRERTFAPQWAYVTPRVEARKERSAKGSAYIDFRVNRTDIDPAYRRNPQELAGIRDTIDLIKNDPDSRIERITITGYASPDGPYDNNARLAEGRTKALTGYVRGLYDFSPEVLRSASVAEDWDGLRRWVEQSSIDNRDALLDIIALSDITPDAREWKIKSKYPAQYRYLLENVYPALRHSDYTIDYVVSSFTDPEKIAEVMARDPRKLSLHEMYLLARSIPGDSARFREVFEVAVRLYPDAPEANLNAAVTALSFDDLDNAARYLPKAGDSAEAVYARGILAAKQGDCTSARNLLVKASQMGLAKADAAIKSLDEWVEWTARNSKTEN